MKLGTLALLAFAANALAQGDKGIAVAPPAKDASVAAELASFEIADGYEVSLFASEEHGIANPIAMRWGPRGRLWVLCTQVYPQVVPTAPPDDKLFILDDTDHDGRADQVSVFADGLEIPTGFAIGNGGVYLGQGTDLLFLIDRDGDGRADQRDLILTGFGTGDTHQNINSLTWSPGGELLFCQGLHNFSRVETPWGIVRMDEHGVWRFRPKRRQLHAFRDCSGQNPWGIAFGRWGEPFAKSNGSELSELLPVMVHTENRHRPLDIGRTRIKSMICEIVDSPALPADLQGDIIIAGYFAHIVDRLKISTDGSGHRGDLLPPLFRTNHQSFRPVDIQTGPDGALYVADWYNPIIGHYQASLRHPDRDKTHGRIWRVTAKGKKTGNLVNLEELPTHGLLDRFKTAPLKERERIRITLSNRDGKTVLADVAAWIRGLDKTDPDYEHHLFEALALYEWNETVNRPLLELLLNARNPLARAYATRVVGRWHDRLEDPLSALTKSISDPHPRVRLEAVVAASYLADPSAATLALRALDAPTDRFIEAALHQCLHALRQQWWPALTAGRLTFASPRHLAHLLPLTAGGGAVEVATAMLKDEALSGELKDALRGVIALHAPVVPREILAHAEKSLPVLEALVERATLGRGAPPTGAPLLVGRVLLDGSPQMQTAALNLAGLWKLTEVRALALKRATDDKTPLSVRVAAIEALAPLRAPETREALATVARTDPVAQIRHAALRTLAPDPAAGVIAAALLQGKPSDDDVKGIVTPFLGHQSGPDVLAAALAASPPKPKVAAQVLAVLGAAGRHVPALDLALAPEPRRDAIGVPAYSEKFVRDLTSDVKASGNSKRGSEVYHRESLSCSMCHLIDVCGRDFGPELTAVGAGLPIELIIEAVVWPRRQVKEGFLSTTITTKDGQVISGYLQSGDPERIVIRDAASDRLRSIAPREVATRQDAGTIMPPGLTAQLTRGELRDLVRYLSERKGAAPADDDGTEKTP